tara:strand:+ start:103 stop:897 length:795 start_codon:yes stop_codon:yes gene_type:complete
MSQRIKNLFLNNKKKLLTFVTGGDPDYLTSLKIIQNLEKNGADIIEIGMPFSDPMADGPIIQASSKRAIEKGIDLLKIFEICKSFRSKNNYTPIILMGYYNIIHHFGVKKFIQECNKNGVDGLIIVDLQPEEDSELYNLVKSTDIDLIRLITPTTSIERLKVILNKASGFLYYITITGITGQSSADIDILKNSISNIKKHTSMPIVAGFGIKSVAQAKEISSFTDGIVVGSAIVKIIEDEKNNSEIILQNISNFVSQLKDSIIK